MSTSEQLQGILDTLPAKPGCYLMKNDTGKIIYVGKAVNLRSRVRSYFHKSAQQDGKTRQLVHNIADIDWIVVGSELEALILEMNLIKKHRPRYNVLLKDDKRYPYIKVYWTEDFPRVTITRNMVKDGSRYFGPYTSAWAMHQTLDILRRVFPYRTCDRDITGKDARSCLYQDIKLCTAPCVGAIDREEYRAVIEDLCRFLEGKTGPIIQRLQAEMEQAAETLRFEQAAVLRDRIQAIEKVVERQKVISTDQMDSDVIAMARSDGEACVQVFFIRSGKLIGREYFILEGTEDEADSEVIAEFVKQFYEKAPSVPPEVLLPNEIEEARIIQTWLNTRRSGSKVKLSVPRRGKLHELVEMATENAVETLKSLRAQWEADTNRQTQALAELQEAFGLPEAPNRIECYDISNTQGTASVGSMVVFVQGTPAKNLYRRFNIKTVVGPDDFASMEEVLLRRFRRWEAAQSAQKLEKKPDPSFSLLPDLLIVDGGKGQLSRAVKVLDQFGLIDKIIVAGLAKQEEELFLPEQEEPIVLERHSQGLYLVQRVRDEAHRFAITAHRKRRTKLGLASRLDSIPGIGPKRRKALLSHFGSLAAIRAASIEELAAVPGITEQLSQAIQSQLE
ncbi:MAG: excinuclease ABC subunit UvrC [Anaerolineaceae bacterium]|nr:excinuclease ABC subunit UvrC [Anaerolineaceae bacterium]